MTEPDVKKYLTTRASIDPRAATALEELTQTANTRGYARVHGLPDAPKTSSKPKRNTQPSKLEQRALNAILDAGLPKPVSEHRFHPTRNWRFDFAWVEPRVALEVEGGLYGKSRHTTLSGYSGDCEKYNAAAIAGWCVIRVTAPMLKTITWLEDLRRVL